MSGKDWLAIIGALMAFALYYPLVKGILRDEIEQNFVTWILWLLLDGIALGSLIFQGGNYLLVIGYCVGGFIVSCCLIYKKQIRWTAKEVVVLSMVIICLIVWSVSGNRNATIASTLAVFISGLLQMSDSWRKPDTQTSFIYLGYVLANGVSCLAGEAWTIKDRFYQAACTILCLIISLASSQKVKDNIDKILSILAGLLGLTAYAIYNQQIFFGKVSPNITSWAIWSFMTLLNFSSYREMSKDGWKSLLPTINSIQCILTFVLTLFCGHFKSIDSVNRTVLIIGISASLLWLKFRKKDGSTMANMMVQVGVTVGFISTFQSVWSRPQGENALCWIIWTASFAVQALVVYIRKGKKRDYVYPLNCLWLHLVVFISALR